MQASLIIVTKQNKCATQFKEPNHYQILLILDKLQNYMFCWLTFLSACVSAESDPNNIT